MMTLAVLCAWAALSSATLLLFMGACISGRREDEHFEVVPGAEGVDAMRGFTAVAVAVPAPRAAENAGALADA